MIGHYLKVVWNRRRANTLILVEILASFLVLCAIFSVVAFYAANWRKPLGFDYHDVWSLVVQVPEGRFDDKERMARMLATSKQLMATLRAHPQIVAAAPMANTPYSTSMSRFGIRLADGAMIQYFWCQTTPEGKDVLELELVAGRWLEPGDEALDFVPNVITESLARRIFGSENPLGRTIENHLEDGKVETPEHPWQVNRVVGVIRDYRKNGEFSDQGYAAFIPQGFDNVERHWAPWSYAIRMQPGTPAAFEEGLLASLHGLAPDWDFGMRPAERDRERYIRERMTPLLAGIALAAFLVLMVGMGLLGVLWQNVTRRTQELGLRRALGATAGAVRNQIIGEIVMLTTLALSVGTVLFLQLPLLGMFSFVGAGVFVTAIVAAALVIVPFVIVCGLYPGWLATQVEPSQALQYE